MCFYEKQIKPKKKFQKESDFVLFFVKIPMHGTKTHGTSPGHDSYRGKIRDAGSDHVCAHVGVATRYTHSAHSTYVHAYIYISTL